MKKYILICFLLHNVAFGQYQSLFGDSTTTWRMVKANGFFGYDHYLVSQDTLLNINGETIYRVKDHTVSGACNIQNFIKEDLVNGKFYYSGNINGPYVLFMDLSMQLGETLSTTWFYSPSGIVDSIYFDGQNKKHIRFSSSMQINEHYEFIEGVGSSRGVPLNCALSPGLSPIFLCKEKDNEIEYYNISTNPNIFIENCHMYFVGIDEQSESFFQLSPNPVNDVLALTIPDGEVLESVKIYDAMGQEVFAQKTNVLLIDVAQLKNGFYTIALSINDKRYAKRFVKV